MMWDLFTEYKETTKGKPIKEHDFVGKDAIEVHRKKERPLTMEGFNNFVANKEGVRSKGVEQYFLNLNSAYEEYLGICSRIKQEIRQDQIEGGMAGIYNPSITQRLNGLVDKTETKLNVEQPLFPDDPETEG